METLWFCLVAGMLAFYVVLDGFDLGAAMVHLFVARNDAERSQVMASIGPVWDGNEVWLLAAGGTLYFAFPALYASSFSGFYLPLMVVLWLLILRGISIEFRNHLRSAVWQPFWDFVFAASSSLLAVFFGAALGNVVRGVPLDAEGEFFLPLWTNFTPGPNPGILDWYTILVGVTASLVLAMHGALWVAHKTEGDLGSRARLFGHRSWWLVSASMVAITITSFQIQPHLGVSYSARPWGYLIPALAIAGLFGIRLSARSPSGLRPFLWSCVFIIALLSSVAFGLYPNVLPSNVDVARSLTVQNTAAAPYGLAIGLRWFIPGMLLTAAYFTYTYRSFAGKVKAGGYGHGSDAAL